MIIKFNCSINDLYKLYVEKDIKKFDEIISNIFNSVESNDNPEITHNNCLDYNTDHSFYISISYLEKILKDIGNKNSLLDDEVIADLLDHCNNIYNLNFLIKKIELV
jgi:Ca2+-binding EF-hand superfamily protein